MVEVLAALGYGAKELFCYNRENFKFDQDQRIERESLRLEMQVKRFELFREDVHDLVELTVDRMDVYHLVGALFLEFCIVLFCEGRIQASAPPFLLSLFLLSNACAFIYLLLAVWLSMHASIAAHSFGVRLLTRFVRLPIPSIKQIGALKSRLTDYEGQGIGNLLRLPGFQGNQEWKQVAEKEEPASASSVGEGGEPASSSSSRPEPKGSSKSHGGYLAVPTSSGIADQPKNSPGRFAGSPGRVAGSPGRPSRPAVSFGLTGSGDGVPKPTSLGKPASPLEESQPQQASTNAPELLPEEMDFPMGGEDLLSSGSGAQPERHIQLFRQLQAKWQCYDAYCRVCMGLGVNQILQGLSYYCICHTLVENHSPTTGYALVVLFQCTTIALAVLDLAGMKRREIIAVQVVGIMPCLLTAWGVAHGMRDRNGVLDPEQKYILSPLSFLCQVLWLELWLRVAAPSTDQAKLPRRFRQVLFLDVFGDAEGWDPTLDENQDEGEAPLDGTLLHGALGPDAENDQAAEEAVEAAARQASSQLTLVQFALQRWRAAPDWTFSAAQRAKLEGLMEQHKSWGNAIATELQRRTARTEDSELAEVFEDSLRQWQDLSPEERLADPFAQCLVGSFDHDNGYETKQYYYDVEGSQMVFEDSIAKTCPGALVLSLDAVAAVMHDLEVQARELLEARITRDLQVATRLQKRLAQEKRKRNQVLRRPALPRLHAKRSGSQGAFPNLVSLFKQRHLPSRRGWRALDREQGLELLGSNASSSALGSISSMSLNETPVSDQATALAEAHAGPPSAPSGWQAQLPPPPQQQQQQQQQPQQPDQTLLAMAGQHARHFVPERLPWQVLSRMTRVLQLGWFYVGIMALLKETNVYQVDYQQHPGRGERRLSLAARLEFERIDVEWPHGDFFRPRGLACLPGGALAVASPFALYRVAAGSPSGPRLPQLEELERLRLPQDAVAMCAAAAGGRRPGAASPSAAPSGLSAHPLPCLVAAPGLEGLSLLPASMGHLGAEWAEVPGILPRTVPIEGVPWKLVAGAIVPCSLVTSLLLEHEDGAAERCLLLAGWDGVLLPVAALPLASGHGWLPAPTARVLPVFDAPLPSTDADRNVIALHLEPRRGRLWAVVADGDLLAWDLFALQSLGRWRPQWPSGTSTAFRPAALCEDPIHGSLFALGRGPLLAEAQVPEELLAASKAEEANQAFA